MSGYFREPVLTLAAIVISSLLTVRAEVVEAQWQVYQIRFFYQGFTTYYTCDGLERKLRRLLLLLGARDDARAESRCVDVNDLRSSSVRRTRRAQWVNLAFAMPVPVDETDLSREIIPAEWQEISVTGIQSRYMEAADCEMLEQFLRYVLPRLIIKSSKNSLYCPAISDIGVSGDTHRNLRLHSSLRLHMVILKALGK